MHQEYRDILVRISEPPSWYDEHGVPRYGEHTPWQCANIYADEVVLLEIGCQNCQWRGRAQISHTHMSSQAILEHDRTGKWPPRLAERVTNGVIHYGDPPLHTAHFGGETESSAMRRWKYKEHRPHGAEGDCRVGATMNCLDLRVLEFWHRNHRIPTTWQRMAELEIALPDLQELSP